MSAVGVVEVEMGGGLWSSNSSRNDDQDGRVCVDVMLDGRWRSGNTRCACSKATKKGKEGQHMHNQRRSPAFPEIREQITAYVYL